MLISSYFVLGICLQCNETLSMIEFNTTNTTIANLTVMALDLAQGPGCSTNGCPSDGPFEPLIPLPGCRNVLGGAKSIYCAAQLLQPSLVALMALALLAWSGL